MAPPTPDQAEVMEQALDDLRLRRDRYLLYRSYYNGAHRIAFASSKFNAAFGQLFEGLTDNLCASVVDSAADRLQLVGFGVEEGPAQAAELAWTLWQHNRMDRRSGEVHVEALREGDAYVIVWPSPEGEDSGVTIYPQRADQVTVGYNTQIPGRILWAGKGWLADDGRYRLTIYYPTHIEKWVTETKTQAIPDRASLFVPYTGDPDAPAGILDNPWDRVPIFHFANNAHVGEFGASELRDVIPLNDGLNKTLADLLVSSEFVALPQRWATGLQLDVDPMTGEPQIPFTPGVERIWTVGDKEVKFGQFDSADLSGHLAMLEMFRMEIARVSATPLHYFMLQGTGNWPSGSALVTAEQRFLAKIKDRMAGYGNVWEDVMAFAVLIQHSIGGVILTADWNDPAPASQLELAQQLEIKKRLGVPTRQIWRELGYTEEEITQMQADKQAEEEASSAALGAAMLEFNAGR